MMQLLDAFLQQQQVTYEQFGLGQTNSLQVFVEVDEAKIKQEKVDEIMEEALDKVYVERGTFDGYDSDGYLACYQTEMELMGISTKHMIKEFDRLVASELRDQIEKLIDKYASNWAKFEEAIVKVGD
ncbi:hypothetical protein L7F22_053164 [Adiantum nelumboides]|nr:hypothetical protein [Adiantum nelumboides]